MKNITQSAILFASLILTLPFMAFFQTLFDRFYPFENSGWVVFGLSLIVSLGFCHVVGSFLVRHFSDNKVKGETVTYRTGKMNREKMLEFAVLLVACMAVCSICLDALFRHTSILIKHNPKGNTVLGVFAGLQLSKVLGHKMGYMIEQPVETKPAAES